MFNPYPAFQLISFPVKLFSLADFEHLGAAARAGTRSGGPLVLHGDGFGVLHLPLSSALNTICFHYAPPIEYERYNIFRHMSIGFSHIFKKW